MPRRSLTTNFWQLLNVCPGEPARIGMMAGFLFFCLPLTTLLRLSGILFFSVAFR